MRRRKHVVFRGVGLGFSGLKFADRISAKTPLTAFGQVVSRMHEL